MIRGCGSVLNLSRLPSGDWGPADDQGHRWGAGAQLVKQAESVAARAERQAADMMERLKLHEEDTSDQSRRDSARYFLSPVHPNV